MSDERVWHGMGPAGDLKHDITLEEQYITHIIYIDNIYLNSPSGLSVGTSEENGSRRAMCCLPCVRPSPPIPQHMG